MLKICLLLRLYHSNQYLLNLETDEKMLQNSFWKIWWENTFSLKNSNSHRNHFFACKSIVL